MKGFRIVEIIKVELENLLLELYFNTVKASQHRSFKINISDDGETILYTENNIWAGLDTVKYDAFLVTAVGKTKGDLANLLGNEISTIRFGVGQLLNSNTNVLYYIKIITNELEFLFFNNGDAGAYSFNAIEEILANDIYGFQWFEKWPIE